MISLSEKIAHARSVEACQFNRPAHSIAALITQYMQDPALLDSIFLIYYDENGNRCQFTYREFIHRVLCTANFLQNAGIGLGSRIATAAHNHPDTIIQYFAAWSIGACVVPLNMTEDDNRLQYILNNSGASLLFCRSEYLQRISALCQNQSLIITETAHHPIAGCTYLLDAKPAELPVNTNMLEAEALIVYTSGTTGNPKGVVLVQDNLFADAQYISEWHGINTNTRMMCVLPVHHVNGCIVTHVTPFVQRASIVLNRKFQTETFFERCQTENVHIVSVVPTLLAYLLEGNTQADKAIQAGLHHIICGAGPLTCELAAAFEARFDIPIIHGYGLSETTCYSCFIPVEQSREEHKHWMQHYGFPSIGIPLDCNQMQIHDSHGNPLQEHMRGEIVIRGYNVMKEYYANEKANNEAFEFGWFRSGDEGFYVNDTMGRPYFFITGRIKELIIRGGINLAPLEIDEVLAKAPGVKAGICVGFVNDFYGEEVGALVIPSDPDTADAQKILDFCQANLPFSKAPKVVLFTDTLPVTSTGKYQRNKVKHLFAEWQSMQFRKK
jgi:long-chain acyl-CoA synthetase